MALAKYRDIQVEVYEAAKQFSDIGAGVGMWPRTWRIMKLLGLDQELAKVALVPPLNIPSAYFHPRRLTRSFSNYYFINFRGRIHHAQR